MTVMTFNHWWCELTGPIVPNQRVEFNYCFVVMLLVRQ